jgi:hypothetical protein
VPDSVASTRRSVQRVTSGEAQRTGLPSPRQPVVHEVNTAVWLAEVAERSAAVTDLASVPSAEWDALVPQGVDMVWLMGVWTRSGAGRAIALANPDLRASWSRDLPDWTEADVAGSPYCIQEYVPSAEFGGWPGLDVARGELRARGARLMVDWVPNHVGPDCSWLATVPDAFVRGTPQDLAADPSAFVEVHGSVFALGKDPYFAAWPDVVQVDAFSPSLRRLAIDALSEVARHADAVRCDMAMLMLDDVVRSTWGDRVGDAPAMTYWTEVIGEVRREHPAFSFVAEAYWDREWDLQQLGFDHCYDKALYDRLQGGDPLVVRGHLDADLGYQQRLVRFLENHDEPRAASTFAPQPRERADAVVIATLPGLTLWHEGQAEGRTTFVPVFLRRRAAEPRDLDLAAWHHALWAAAPGIRVGDWARCDVVGWPDNSSADALLAWKWTSGASLALVVVNLGGGTADGMVHVGHEAAAGRRWLLTDVLDGTTYDRDGDDLAVHGLYVSRPGWAFHVLSCRPDERGSGSPA